MTRFSRLVIASFIVFFPIVAGCQPQYGGNPNSSLGIPENGKVRVVTTPLESGTDKLHYKWSLIGGINWRKASVDNTSFTLADTYALNSATERGGCNVYEADLQADKTTGKWKAVLHGSDGTTVRTEGNLPSGGVGAIRILHDADTKTLGLPTQITLADIDGKLLRIQVAR